MRFLNIRDLKRAEGGDNTRNAALAKHLSNAIHAEARRFNFKRFAIGLAASIAIVFGVTMAGRLFRQVNMYACPLMIVGLGCVGFLTRRLTMRDASRQLAATAVAEGICGTCAYSLESVPAGLDGCLVCPECGAAWHKDRVTRPHWEKPQSTILFEPSWFT